MSYSPRQLVVRAREAAALLLRALERERQVARFLDSYAAEFNRPGETAHPAHYRELLTTIGREALLTMVAWLNEELPRRLADSSRARGYVRKARVRSKSQRRASPQAASAAATETTELFRDEFLVTLAQELGWGDEAFEEFCRDLELYAQLGANELRAAKVRKVAVTVSGPFVDRVGLLLDSSMLEKARRAAAKFQIELHATTAGILKKVFSRRREN